MNAKGEALFYTVLRSAGSYDDDEVRSLWEKRCEQARNNFRRCLRYFHEACEKRGIVAEELRRYKDVRLALHKAMAQLRREGQRSPRVIGDVKTAVSVTYGYRFPDKPLLTHDRVARDLLASYMKGTPVRRPQLEIPFTWQQLAAGLKQLPLPADLETPALAGKTACLVRATTGTRTTEIAQIDREATKPSPDGRTWSFWLRVKNRPQLEKVTVHKNDDVRIDPIAHLLEMRTRARRTPTASSCHSIWLRADGSKMTPRVIRAATVKTMHAAHVNDNCSYHLKHCVATYLIDAGLRESEIRSFLRHSQSSRVLEERYIDFHNNNKCIRALTEEAVD